MQITGISESAFQALRSQLASGSHAELTGTTSGTIVGHGIAADYEYDAASQTLTVDIIHHPMLVPASVIESRLRAALADH